MQRRGALHHKINIKYFLVLVILLLSIGTMISKVVIADPPGSPPFGAYIEVVASNKGAENFKGSLTTVRISFPITVPAGEYGTLSITFSTEIKAAMKASAYAASAIAATYEYGTNKLLNVGGHGAYDFKSYDGITCDHTMVVTGLTHYLKITHKGSFLIVTYYYIVHGYYWKHGALCSDEKIPFNLDVSSDAVLFKG